MELKLTISKVTNTGFRITGKQIYTWIHLASFLNRFVKKGSIFVSSTRKLQYKVTLNECFHQPYYVLATVEYRRWFINHTKIVKVCQVDLVDIICPHNDFSSKEERKEYLIGKQFYIGKTYEW